MSTLYQCALKFALLKLNVSTTSDPATRFPWRQAALGAHAAQGRHGFQALKHRGSFEHQDGSQGEAGISPVAVE